MRTKARILALALVMVAIPALPQVTFLLESIPGYTPEGDLIYLAGDINGWNPGSPEYALARNQEGLWFITLPARAAGTQIQFKFTRGGWDKVEKGPNGEEISNRRYTFGGADTVRVTVHNWADRGGGATTATKNVIKLNPDLFMPQLNRTRRVWVYLPPDYEESDKDYPVLYMQDGQNVFDAYTSFAGEWMVNENLNELAESGKEVPIVVAIDNGGARRINEYSPWVNPTYGGGEGDLYIEFIANTLKPHIDSTFRTQPGRESTGIMGSSMGGLISFYGALQRPDVFGKAGAFSPSYWFSDSLWTFTKEAGRQHPIRLYQLVGTGEGSSTVTRVLRMQDTLLTLGFHTEEIKTTVVDGGQHNEQFWRAQFREAILWLFPETSGISQVPAIEPNLRIYPNPASDVLHIEVKDIPQSQSYVSLYDLSGACIRQSPVPSDNRLDISHLPAGWYLVKISMNGKTSARQFFKL